MGIGIVFLLYSVEWRRNGVQVYANTRNRTSNTGHLCGTVTGKPNGSDIPDVMNITCDVNARYVTVYQGTNNSRSTALDFQEVEVYVCQQNVGYGSHCTKCNDRHCADSHAPCDIQTGSCSGGCQAGWNGTDCTQECDHRYGMDCSLDCSTRHCKDDDSQCDSQTGECVGGCKPGWMNTTCTQQCAKDQYGDGCKQSCSQRNCVRNEPCFHETGKCISGCKWDGLDCHAVLAIMARTAVSHVGTVNPKYAITFPEPALRVAWMGLADTCAKNVCIVHCVAGLFTSTVLIAGTFMGVILLTMLIVIIAVVLIRRHRMSNHETMDNTTSKEPKSKCSKAKREIQQKSEYVNIAYLDGPVPEGSGILEDRNQADQYIVTVNTDSGLEEVDEEEDTMDTSETEYCNISNFNLPVGGVVVSDLPRILEKIRNQPGGFETEYKKLPNGFSFPYDDSQISQNRSKNRFRGYYPYDNNRVILTMLPDVPYSDYINASFLDAYQGKDYFIAAQAFFFFFLAPNKNTLPDFWRMMWEKECGHIIMLTKLVEATKAKCEPYWSDKKAITIGKFTVADIENEERSDFVYRKFCVTHIKSGKSKTFQQSHFISWPDHGVPNVHDFTEFMWRVRKTKPTLPGPVLVHCSAGIGRTGTYIALEILLDEMEATGRVDVLKVMTKMRDQRKGLVQTKIRYTENSTKQYSSLWLKWHALVTQALKTQTSIVNIQNRKDLWSWERKHSTNLPMTLLP
ncbi:receptor-type tyrosine-protein phosphatase T-like [Gigantopelta aegis]|uniref:receptor-type tyrosine-protein phosphatase T-like n=1 Tax=Gigantopelta aegis TaxID=1735272 RepID=UPI001B88A2D1|nr:receptor-type tyrosine-protein phosphatase T-like [Gigantopelta aegis]